MNKKPSKKVHLEKPCVTHGIKLLHLCFLIAMFDFGQSVYFLVQSTALLVLNVNLYTVIAILGSIFWLLMVILLLVGLWKDRVRFIISWLIFSVIGIILDIFFFASTITVSQYVQWTQIIQFTVLYLGIVIEWVCIYIVYRYCLKIGSVRVHDEPEEGHRDSRDDPKKLQQSQTSVHPNESSGPATHTEDKSDEPSEVKHPKIELPDKKKGAVK